MQDADQRYRGEHHDAGAWLRNVSESEVDTLDATTSGQMQESQTKGLQLQLTDMKSRLDAQTAEAQSCQAADAEASGQLQKEQGKLTELQDRVDRLYNTLQKLSGSPQ